jgi:hypothetical protein
MSCYAAQRGTTHIINLSAFTSEMLRLDPYIYNVRGTTHIINLSADIYNVTPYIINVRDDIKDVKAGPLH